MNRSQPAQSAYPKTNGALTQTPSNPLPNNHAPQTSPLPLAPPSYGLQKKLYVVGFNDKYQFGLGHKEIIAQLTEWSDVSNLTNQVYANKINTSLAGLIVTDFKGNHWSMGINQHGECGIPDHQYVTNPTEVQYFYRNNLKVNKIFANTSGWTVFWLTTNNQVYGNGYNTFHQLGVGDTEHKFIPTRVPLKNIIKMSSAEKYSLALDSKGRVFSTTYSQWGGNVHGNVINNYGWKVVPGLKDIIDIDNGDEHSLFLSSDGVVYGVGRRDLARLGNAEHKRLATVFTKQNQTISPIPYFKNNRIFIKQVTCGRAHNLCIDNHGKVWSWGSNFYGQCGDPRFGVCTPQLVVSFKEDTVVEIRCGSDHSYVRTAQEQHCLFGSNQHNECSLMDGGADKIGLPHCINHVIRNGTGGEIEEVCLGRNCTMIMICILPYEIEDEETVQPDTDSDNDVIIDMENEQKIEQLEELNSAKEARIVQLNIEVSKKQQEILDRGKAIVQKDNHILSLVEQLSSLQETYTQYRKRMETEAQSLRQEKEKQTQELEKQKQVNGRQRRENEKQKQENKKQRQENEALKIELDRGKAELEREKEKAKTQNTVRDEEEEEKEKTPAEYLREWNLEKYIDSFVEENGYDDIEDWEGVTMEELTELDFEPEDAKEFIKRAEILFQDRLFLCD